MDMKTRLAALCARSEHCRHDIMEKMRRNGVPQSEQDEIIAFLERERFIDDARYARFFINDKIKFNRWGRYKVIQALRMKHIDEDIYRPILDEYDDTDDYSEALTTLLRSKMRTTKADTPYLLRMKLMRYAASRGYDLDVINETLDTLLVV